MKNRHFRIGALLALAAMCTLARADLVFAINEGVTYRVPNEEIRAKYAAIAADLGKLLKQPVHIEPVADYPSLRKGLADQAYDLTLLGLDTSDDGRKKLEPTRYSGFARYDTEALMSLGSWLGL